MPPRAFLVTKPTSQSVLFGGRYINVTFLAAHIHIDKGHLSRVLRGVGDPSVKLLTSISEALFMPLPEVIEAVQELHGRKQDPNRGDMPEKKIEKIA